jgi:hypothetical protein
LQVVLIQLLVLLLMRAPSWKGGIIAGTITAISLVVGLETAPQVAVLIAVMAILWVTVGWAEYVRLGGFAVGVGGATLFFLAFLRPTYWSSGLCDAFTPASSTATLAVAAALALLAAATGRLTGWRSRFGTGTILAVGALAAILIAFPSCINGPYGEMDPFLRRSFLPFIDEANGIFAQPRAARIIAVGGVLAAACVAAVWMLLRTPVRWPALLPIAAVITVSTVITLFQVRGAYIGAPLGAPVLAGLVVTARQRTTWQVPAVIAAWLAGAGMAYFTIPAQIEKLAVGPGAATELARPRLPFACSIGDTWKQVDRFPPGVVMAGTSVASYLVGATHHSTIGASYHRNDAGNMAMYRFFLSRPDRSREIAREWKSGYVIFCPGDFGEIAVTRNFPNSLAARLQRGEAPPWLESLPLRNTPLHLYKVR